jgi:penicillin V acylase-like amidase (Ntn superfamily)
VSEREAVSELLAVTRNVSVPLGSPFAEYGIFSTEYRTLMNLSLRRYYFELADSPNVLRADLDLLHPAADGRTLMFDPAIGDPNGNVSELFIPAAPLY